MNVKIVEENGEYYRKPLGYKGKTWTVPLGLFEKYVGKRTLRRQYPPQIKDKPMLVAKYHPIPVAPGEIVTFNQDEADPAE